MASSFYTPAETQAMRHGMNCPARNPYKKDDCKCGLQWRDEIERLHSLLRDVYWPLSNVRRFDPNGDERYPHAHPDLLEKIREMLADSIPAQRI